MGDIIVTVLLVVLLAGVFACLIVFGIREDRYQKEKAASYSPKDDPTTYEYEPTVTELHVRVIDLRCGVTSGGVHIPQTVEEYLVVYCDDGGTVGQVSVNAEQYSGVEVGQIGTLMLVDGQVYSFVPDGSYDG